MQIDPTIDRGVRHVEGFLAPLREWWVRSGKPEQHPYVSAKASLQRLRERAAFISAQVRALENRFRTRSDADRRTEIETCIQKAQRAGLGADSLPAFVIGEAERLGVELSIPATTPIPQKLAAWIEWAEAEIERLRSAASTHGDEPTTGRA